MSKNEGYIHIFLIGKVYKFRNAIFICDKHIVTFKKQYSKKWHDNIFPNLVYKPKDSSHYGSILKVLPLLVYKKVCSSFNAKIFLFNSFVEVFSSEVIPLFIMFQQAFNKKNCWRDHSIVQDIPTV